MTLMQCTCDAQEADKTVDSQVKLGSTRTCHRHKLKASNRVILNTSQQFTSVDVSFHPPARIMLRVMKHEHHPDVAQLQMNPCQLRYSAPQVKHNS